MSCVTKQKFKIKRQLQYIIEGFERIERISRKQTKTKTPQKTHHFIIKSINDLIREKRHQIFFQKCFLKIR